MQKFFFPSNVCIASFYFIYSKAPSSRQQKELRTGFMFISRWLVVWRNEDNDFVGAMGILVAHLLLLTLFILTKKKRALPGIN